MQKLRVIRVTYMFDELGQVGGEHDPSDIEGSLEGRPWARHRHVLPPVIEDLRRWCVWKEKVIIILLYWDKTLSYEIKYVINF